MEKEKNNIKTLKIKLTIEAIIKSALIGIAFGFMFGFVIAFIGYLASTDLVLVSIIVSSVLAVMMGLLLYFFGFRPTKKVMASRIDSVGLEERVITMLELEGEDSLIANKQREDAEIKLKTVTPKQVKFSKLLKPLIAFVLVVALSTVMITQLSFKMDAIREQEIIDNQPPVREGIDKQIESLIANLRELVKKAEVSDSLKTDLNLIIDNLESYVYNLETDLQKLAAVSETSELIYNRIIDEMIKNLKTLVDNAEADKWVKDECYALITDLESRVYNLGSYRDKVYAVEQTRREILKKLGIIWISDELQKRDSTELIGDAIESRRPEDVDKAINDIIDRFIAMPYNEDKEHMLLTMIEDLEDSLEAANEDNPPLREILEELIEILKKMLQVIQSEGDIPKATEEMEDELKQLGEQMKDALNEEKSDEEQLGEDMEDEMDDLIEGNLPKDDEDDEDKEDEEEESDKPSKPTDPEDGDGKPVEAGKQTVIDGTIYYEDELENLITELTNRIANDNTLTESERAALNAYLANIIRQITEQESN